MSLIWDESYKLLKNDYPSRVSSPFSLDGSKIFFDTFVSLPSSFDLTDHDMEYVVEIVNKF